MHKKIFGFSIAEALITMFVITLVAIVSAPVLTKKKIPIAQGSWQCVFDDVSQTYVSSGKNVALWPSTEEGCVFQPPQGGKNFAINAIGGGGGGASASINPSVEALNTGIYTPEVSGYYMVMAIGGGGAGGRTNCSKMLQDGDTRAQGGAAGNIQAAVLYLKKNTFYEVMVGEAGQPGQFGGMSGNTSYFKLKNASGYLVAAIGGNGGRGSWSGYNIFNVCNHTKGYLPSENNTKAYTMVNGKQVELTPLGKDANSTVSNIKGTQPAVRPTNRTGADASTKGIGKVCNATNCGQSGCYKNTYCNPDILKVANLSGAGYGGEAGPGKSGTSKAGGQGAVIVKFMGLYSGGGGQSGGHAYRVYKTLKGKYKVVPGLGGDGADEMNADGKAGTSSSFGDLLTAGGGSGGKAKARIGNPLSPLTGEKGYDSPMGTGHCGGLNPGATVPLHGNVNKMLDGCGTDQKDGSFTNYGAGGGGGASLDPDDTKNSCGTNDQNYKGCWGYGGRGTNGIVYVQWN